MQALQQGRPCDLMETLKALLHPCLSQASSPDPNWTIVELPTIPIQDIIQICRSFEEVVAEEPTMLNVSGPCVVVGDIHGHLPDLLRIIHRFGLPDKTRYLFLGDLVDRGEFSIETVIIVFLFKIIWPKNAFVIRGNHEFEFLCSQCGFSLEVTKAYGTAEILSNFYSAFSQIPIAAVLNSRVLCVHGGIGPSLSELNQISEVRRPMLDFGNELIDSLLWSDPSDTVSYFEASPRGTGYYFGEKSVSILEANQGIDLIVRAHECVKGGYSSMFGGKIVTVFSASNYCGLIGNDSAVLEFGLTSEFKAHTFCPLKYLRRVFVTFKNVLASPLPPIQSNRVLRKGINAVASTNSIPMIHGAQSCDDFMAKPLSKRVRVRPMARKSLVLASASTKHLPIGCGLPSILSEKEL